MDQQRIYAEQYNRIIGSFLENPGQVGRADREQLEKLIELYPYSQPLRLIYAASNNDDRKTAQASLALASAYAPQREVLYNIIQQPGTFKSTLSEKRTVGDNSTETGFLIGNAVEPPAHFEEVHQGASETPTDGEDNRDVGLPEDVSSPDPIFASIREVAYSAGDKPNERVEEDETLEEISEVNSPYEPNDAEIASPDHNAIIESDEVELDEDEPIEEISEVNSPYETNEAEIVSPDHNAIIKSDEVELDEDEPLEEISEVTGPYETDGREISSPKHNTFEADAPPPGEDEPIEEISEAPQPDWGETKDDSQQVSHVENSHPEKEKDEALQQEKLIGSIAGSDFFAFEKSVVDPLQTEDSNRRTEPRPQQAREQNVSKYNDDKLPYTFLWWLNKTRKEHAETYQPYANFSLDTTKSIRRTAPVEELNHQIIENIFHLKTPLDDLGPEASSATVEFELKRKEDVIIEKFIKEEPQIKPPQLEKIDTENKARRSAEDPNDLVSETLARIYTDQMLYHKAIDTYKKLSLKFPEKSTFFANQIVELENKIN